MFICGIDEAGRGPVIGPLVIAGVLANEEQEKQLMELGVKDSKLLTPIQRERMFDKIKAIVENFEIIAIDPPEIDAAVNGEGGLNLNWLEAVKSAKIINKLKPNKAILDCPSTNVKAYTEYVKKLVTGRADILSEHKADQTYPIVSAASILAKVTRDDLIQELKKKHKVEFGSGYPSDPMTQLFIKKFWNKYDFFRKSWASYKAISKGKSQTKLFSDE
ncbi:MAG TPA: ribonuclease HII [Candidatus Nanoarchaeia archaeon]|nr:ribonuclease HII [Candidatus Nanoarchaeia archaeon]